MLPDELERVAHGHGHVLAATPRQHGEQGGAVHLQGMQGGSAPSGEVQEAPLITKFNKRFTTTNKRYTVFFEEPGRTIKWQRGVCPCTRILCVVNVGALSKSQSFLSTLFVHYWAMENLEVAFPVKALA
jgi:hypothetical protein